MNGRSEAAGRTLSLLPRRLSVRPAPRLLVQAVEGFLSPDPEIRIRAFERVWPAQSGAATLGRRSLWTAGVIGTPPPRLLCCLRLHWWPSKTSSPVSGPLESTQITSSAEPKEGPLFTDGSRLYFDSRGTPSEMAVGGGPIVPMRILERGMVLLDISADASKALGFKQAAKIRWAAAPCGQQRCWAGPREN